ncbi:MAG: aminoacyl-tRNA hydrolase [Coriobacteriia bacterium]|nr:aminoacyl-tRNA hydrolase [Coriobacteriia bacterium]
MLAKDSTETERSAGPSLLVGLGNPGPEYERTRHNAGALTVEAIAGELGGNYWKTMGSMLVCECRYQGKRIWLARSRRYMNEHGKPVKALLGQLGLQPDDLLVVHDELDLPPATLRLKQGGGHAGHRGVASVIEAIGPDFARLRIGIGHPPGQMPADRFVLQEMKGEIWEEFRASLDRAVPIALDCIADGVLAAMNRFNGEA